MCFIQLAPFPLEIEENLFIKSNLFREYSTEETQTTQHVNSYISTGEKKEGIYRLNVMATWAI